MKNTTEESKLSRFKLKKDPTESRRVRNPAICRVAFSKKLPFEFNMQLDKENKLSIDLNYSKIVCSGQEEFISSDSYKDFIGLLD